MVLTMAAGLLLRFGALGFPPMVVKYGGSTMWALMIYWVVAVVMQGRWGPGRAGVVAGLLAAAVEFLKLYRTPWMDAFRLTLPGVLLLGRYFSWWDVAAYLVAIAAGAMVDARVLRPEWHGGRKLASGARLKVR